MAGHKGATLLRIDLSRGAIAKEPIARRLQELFIGGRGLGSKLLVDQIRNPRIDAFDPSNPLIFATGPLTGTYAPTGGRYMVITKSPLTGAIACSNSGGYWGPALRFAGYDFLMIEGRASEPVYVYVIDDHVEIRPAKHLWGKQVHEVEDSIRNETHPDVKVASIGPAGEQMAHVACVMNDKGRAAGRSGVGAVMGSKNLKAIAVWGTKGVRVPDTKQFQKTAGAAVRLIGESPVAGGLTMLGTAATVEYMNMAGILPTRNFQFGTFDGASKVGGERVKSDFMTRNRGCHSCVINCGRVTKVTGHGRFDGKGEGPEYETIFGVGTACGIDDLAAILKANYLCNELGMDTIEAGCSIATAMELYERGYIPERDIGKPLQFGNAEAMVEMMELMGKGQGFGKLLQEGGYRLAAKYGHPELFIGSKKQAFAAYDPRGSVGMGLGYATSNRGACHLRGYSIALEHFGNPIKLDPLTTKDKALWMKTLQDSTAFVDSSGVCLFATMAMPQETLVDMVNSALDLQLDVPGMLRSGERIWNLERLFNNEAGLTREDDSLPPRMLQEPLPEGPSKGHVVPLQEMLDDYYWQRGWDPDGNPTQTKLKALSLLA
ncbi:MAG TPA: aldehyde ferredoxin oxidoreductase family protein [Thermoplasmata archaeon]|nr:aldehyde ferredoxin oxidoreductase family protein [Thermoplasmata archaeon]